LNGRHQPINANIALLIGTHWIGQATEADFSSYVCNAAGSAPTLRIPRPVPAARLGRGGFFMRRR